MPEKRLLPALICSLLFGCGREEAENPPAQASFFAAVSDDHRYMGTEPALLTAKFGESPSYTLQASGVSSEGNVWTLTALLPGRPMEDRPIRLRLVERANHAGEASLRTTRNRGNSPSVGAGTVKLEMAAGRVSALVNVFGDDLRGTLDSELQVVCWVTADEVDDSAGLGTTEHDRLALVKDVRFASDDCRGLEALRAPLK